MTQALPELHLLEEVAERYRLSLIGLQRKARKRAFTHIKIGKQRYLTGEQVLELLQGATVTSATASQREQDLAGTAERVARRRPRTKTS
ncbi:hypothetical protein GA0074692_6835 [Micromonospora pallida]|uniref:Helix-turn-helix domain-containing protein n=1 Tax=Micromonospora pallida TaxID=145854 RepID=A0A1C6RIG1_9ACTN|nr:hypothetical protein [Micromonospora pallida]SCL16500.1 hypothetical protein GA0074692_0043 [Micromonospora pallida]SCL16986.1 hypothetical protein GA0074692_0061 [Micromonospora pallida]SCL43349.1 hypothetical protein GA0074692_6835 [Micromonospora pallida]